ncbi:Fic/DOC family protein [Pseudonocardia sp. CA-142604]|uniref:Fic/DOC family protein n=1 Tax=Pseudonocardia sp. CA-142604 TaxID=3240024 RepID=UPI003D91DDDF
MSWDPYLDLDTGVLHNRLGISDRLELARAEADLTASRLYDLQRTRLTGDYDLDHLRSFHRVIFGDVYDWAGELRTVSIGRGGLFCLPGDLVSSGSEVFDRLAHAQYLRGLDREKFVDRLADLLADVNYLHPFREGNGRTQRAFLAQLARDAGHRIRWALMDPTTNVAASAAALRGDNRQLRHLLDLLVVGGGFPAGNRPEQPPRPSEPG